jgi:hypothetical protein
MGHTPLSLFITFGYLGNLYSHWEWLEVDQELGACKEAGSPQRIHHTIPKEDDTADLLSSTNHPVKMS